jgi:hypothetical protein
LKKKSNYSWLAKVHHCKNIIVFVDSNMNEDMRYSNTADDNHIMRWNLSLTDLKDDMRLGLDIIITRVEGLGPEVNHSKT